MTRGPDRTPSLRKTLTTRRSFPANGDNRPASASGGRSVTLGRSAASGEDGGSPAERPDWRQKLIESPKTQAITRALVVLGVGMVREGVGRWAASWVPRPAPASSLLPAHPKTIPATPAVLTDFG